MNYLAKVVPVFELAEKYANLRLNGKKCKIVPVHRALTLQLKVAIYEWLQDNVPKWRSFTVTDHVKYLGLELGPNAQQFQWPPVMATW